MPSDKSQPDEHKAKKPRTFRLWAFAVNGRRGGIRTRDPLHPMQVRYQAALHADKPRIIACAARRAQRM